MCGIAGLYLKDPSIVDTENDRIQFDRLVDELLLGIESRGRDATGYASANQQRWILDKKDVRASDFVKIRKRAWMEQGTRIVIGHTRLETQGDSAHFENNHPVLHGTTLVAHNGHISNDWELFNEFQLDRTAEVDSEAIAAMLDYFTFNNAKEALETLSGGFAISAINPKENPDTLLLAKGNGSPLSIYESRHLVLWASESKVIKDVWEKVLGTPPDFKTMVYMAAGDVMWVRDGEVELQRKFFTPQTQTYTGYATGSWYGSGYSSRSTGRTARKRLNTEDAIALIRDNGGGYAVTFERKDDMTADQLRAYDGVWITCIHCNDMVAALSIVEHDEYGEMCVDCMSLLLAIEKKKAEEKSKKGAEWAGLSEEDIAHLNEYAEIDMETVRDCVNEVADETGLPSETVHWLLWCSDHSDLGIETEKLRESLMAIYVEKESDYFADFSFKGDDEDDGTREVPGWGEICTPPERQLPSGIDEKLKCDLCKKKASYFLYRHRWCKKHMSKCARRGCRARVVGYTPDSKMHCHEHSRGQKGLKYVKQETVVVA